MIAAFSFSLGFHYSLSKTKRFCEYMGNLVSLHHCSIWIMLESTL